jgi:catechol 2,3-dioxygenase-like lactoylglutathione lyase family enzyme
LCVALPCENIIIVSETDGEILEEDVEHVTFKNWKLHHVNLQATDVRKSVEFLSTNLGLREGSWRPPDEKGDFSIEPKDLSVFPIGAFNGGLHIIKPDPGFALRNNFAHNPSIGGHPAIMVQDIQAVKNRLEAENVQVTDAGTYAMRNMHQIYCLDPSGNVIEINQYVPS